MCTYVKLLFFCKPWRSHMLVPISKLISVTKTCSSQYIRFKTTDPISVTNLSDCHWLHGLTHLHLLNSHGTTGHQCCSCTDTHTHTHMYISTVVQCTAHCHNIMKNYLPTWEPSWRVWTCSKWGLLAFWDPSSPPPGSLTTSFLSQQKVFTATSCSLSTLFHTWRSNSSFLATKHP